MNQFFVEALDTREHPIKKARKKIQAEYITALTYIIEKTISKVNRHQAEIKNMWLHACIYLKVSSLQIYSTKKCVKEALT